MQILEFELEGQVMSQAPETFRTAFCPVRMAQRITPGIQAIKYADHAQLEPARLTHRKKVGNRNSRKGGAQCCEDSRADKHVFKAINRAHALTESTGSPSLHATMKKPAIKDQANPDPESPGGQSGGEPLGERDNASNDLWGEALLGPALTALSN